MTTAKKLRVVLRHVWEFTWEELAALNRYDDRPMSREDAIEVAREIVLDEVRNGEVEEESYRYTVKRTGGAA